MGRGLTEGWARECLVETSLRLSPLLRWLAPLSFERRVDTLIRSSSQVHFPSLPASFLHSVVPVVRRPRRGVFVGLWRRGQARHRQRTGRICSHSSVLPSWMRQHETARHLFLFLLLFRLSASETQRKERIISICCFCCCCER